MNMSVKLLRNLIFLTYHIGFSFFTLHRLLAKKKKITFTQCMSCWTQQFKCKSVMICLKRRHLKTSSSSHPSQSVPDIIVWTLATYDSKGVSLTSTPQPALWNKFKKFFTFFVLRESVIRKVNYLFTLHFVCKSWTNWSKNK